MEWVFWVVLGGVILLAVASVFDGAIGRRTLRDAVGRCDDLDVTVSFVSDNGRTAIAIDNQRSLMRLFQKQHEEVISRDIRFSDLLCVDLLQDGQTLTRMSRSSQVANAMLGGLVLGGTGFLVGALTGTKVSDQKIKRIDVQLTINDIRNPTFGLNFMATRDTVGTVTYAADLKSAQEWVGRFKVIIQAADQRDEADPSGPPKPVGSTSPIAIPYQPITLSVADEIRKLSELVKEGVISQDEFNVQKTRLFLGG